MSFSTIPSERIATTGLMHSRDMRRMLCIEPRTLNRTPPSPILPQAEYLVSSPIEPRFSLGRLPVVEMPYWNCALGTKPM